MATALPSHVFETSLYKLRACADHLHVVVGRVVELLELGSTRVVLSVAPGRGMREEKPRLEKRERERRRRRSVPTCSKGGSSPRK
eukprot:509872-Hanusia_phi.AAC.2